MYHLFKQHIMKKQITILLALFIVFSINAQRNIEKTVSISKNQELFVNFKFASTIKIEQWNKNEVFVKAEVTIDDGKGNGYFSIKSSKRNNNIKLVSDFGDYYKNRNKQRNVYFSKDCCNSKTEIIYTLYIPKGTKVTIKSISGSVMADEFTGTLVTDLISGDVTLKKHSGELQLKTISGNLDVVITNATLRAKTLTGTIYSNLEIDLDSNTSKNNSGYNKINGIINKGGKNVTFETISGNIYLRKTKTI